MLKVYNSLTRKIEEFKPLHDKVATVYTCGPTVYDYATIGNFRTYTLGDILVRTLMFLGYEVKYAMNVTDVGHLTGDNLGDADTGQDRMEKSAKKQGKTAWEIAEFYTNVFKKDYKRLHITFPNVGEKRNDPEDLFVRATNHIKEQIELVQKLIDKGFVYTITDGIYFDTSKMPSYGELSTLDRKNLQRAERIEPNPEKKNPEDFALWKFSPKDEKRQMEWDSPWGKGFPGWHIECSAMSMKYLGETIDVHVGGEDLRMTHHPNEIAQSEAATGKKFVRVWLHGAFILIEGQRMGKSLGNAYTVQNLIDKGYDPLALRYLYLTGHYRSKLNFTWDSLDAAQKAFTEIKELLASWPEKGKMLKEYKDRFTKALENDLNMPEALAVLWEMLRSKEASKNKKATTLELDRVLGLGLKDVQVDWTTEENGKKVTISGEINKTKYEAIKQKLLKRDQARKDKDYQTSDAIRDELSEEYEIKDTEKGTVIKKK